MSNLLNQRKTNSRLLGIKRVLILLCFICILPGIFFWEYKTKDAALLHSMEELLNDWANDYEIRVFKYLPAEHTKRNLQPSNRQTVDAFQKFGRPGVEFLIANARQTPPLNPIKWKVKRWLADVTNNPNLGRVPPFIEAAQSLLMQIEKPYEWVEQIFKIRAYLLLHQFAMRDY